MVRRRKNKIDGLYEEVGVWRDDLEVMKTTAMLFFHNVFAYNEDPDLRFHIPNLFPILNQCLIKDLCNLVTFDEVKSAIFDMGNLKLSS